MPFRHGGSCGKPYGVTCWACLGEGECDKCQGTGTLIFDRCAVCLSEPWMPGLLRFYRLQGRGFLPAAGGTLDQTHVWMLLFELIDRLWRHHEAAWIERNSRKQK